MCSTTFVYVRDVNRTVHFPLGQSDAALGVAGGGMVGENVIWPLRGVMFCTGPVTFSVTMGWPGATLPPWFTHSNFASTLLAVRKASVGPFPRPAAFPLHVRPLLRDFVHVGVPMKCALLAIAAGANVSPASASADTAILSCRDLRILVLLCEMG